MSLSLQPRDRVTLRIDVPSRQQPQHVHRIGTAAIVVEHLGREAWLVEVRVPDLRLEGDAWFETLEVYGSEIAALRPATLGAAGSGV